MAFGCCKSNDAVVREMNVNQPSAIKEDPPSVGTAPSDHDNDDERTETTDKAVMQISGTKSSSRSRSRSMTEKYPSKDGSNKYGDFFTEEESRDEEAPVSLSRVSSACSSVEPSIAPSVNHSVATSVVTKQTSNATASKQKTIIRSFDDESDDGITTVYSEPDPRRFDGQSANTKVMEPIEENEYFVQVPDIPHRGYESDWGSFSSYEDATMIREKAYKIGTPVWYRRDSPFHKFVWYIPGSISSFVLNDDEVTGYVINIDCDDESMEACDSEILDILKNASPTHTCLRWDEEVPSCPIPGHDVTKESVENRLKKSKEEYGDDFGFEGVKQNGLGPEMWGITKAQILALKEDSNFHSDMTMYDVVNEIVKPKTANTGLGYALHENEDSPQGAKVVVSHAWQQNFEQFCECLQRSPVEGPFWISAFSIYQNEDMPEVTIAKQLGPSPRAGPLATVLKQSEEMLAIMSKECDIYSRLWCVYEIFVAMQLNVPVSLIASNEETSFDGSLSANLNAIMDSTSKPIHTSEAKCGLKVDQEMIEAEIENAGGLEVIDDAVMWIRIKSLADMNSGSDETAMNVPIGSCSSSNIDARQNAGCANAIAVWEKTKASRVSKLEKTMSFATIRSFVDETFRTRSRASDTSQVSVGNTSRSRAGDVSELSSDAEERNTEAASQQDYSGDPLDLKGYVSFVKESGNKVFCCMN